MCGESVAVLIAVVRRADPGHHEAYADGAANIRHLTAGLRRSRLPEESTQAHHKRQPLGVSECVNVRVPT